MVQGIPVTLPDQIYPDLYLRDFEDMCFFTWVGVSFDDYIRDLKIYFLCFIIDNHVSYRAFNTVLLIRKNVC